MPVWLVLSTVSGNASNEAHGDQSVAVYLPRRPTLAYLAVRRPHLCPTSSAIPWNSISLNFG